MSDQTNKGDTTSQFEELPDAPPRRRVQLSWGGKIGACIISFWIVIIFIGPIIAPYHEADILDEALFIVPGSDNPYPDTDFQPTCRRIGDQAADGSADFDEACEHEAIRQISVGLWSRRETRDWQTAFTGGEKAYQQRINGMAISCCQ